MPRRSSRCAPTPICGPATRTGPGTCSTLLCRPWPVHRTEPDSSSAEANAYDEALTTSSAASALRALAIQMIIDKEWGLSINESPLQGSHVVDQLTDLVEEAVLAEFEAIAERRGS